jgi:hypothetical protein
VSLYRETSRAAGRTLALVAAAAVVVGLLVGFALGRSSAPEPSLADRLDDVRAELKPARQGLELVGTEYPQAVRGGRVVAPTEYKAAQADVERVRSAVDGARDDLRALGATRAAAVDRAVAAVAAAVDRRADPAEVRRLARVADAAVVAAVGS